MATRSTKLTIAATTLIVVGVIETALLVYAILHGTGFSGGSLFYCYAGYKLLKRSAAVYRWVAAALWVFLALIIAATASILIWAVQLLSVDGMSVSVAPSWWMLVAALYVGWIPLLTAFLHHPDTRAEFGLSKAGDSPWMLYLGLGRSVTTLAIAGGMTAVLIGPHLLSNVFETVAFSLRQSEGVTRTIGSVESLVLIDASENNWTVMTNVRAKGSKARGSIR